MQMTDPQLLHNSDDGNAQNVGSLGCAIERRQNASPVPELPRSSGHQEYEGREVHGCSITLEASEVQKTSGTRPHLMRAHPTTLHVTNSNSSRTGKAETQDGKSEEEESEGNHLSVETCPAAAAPSEEADCDNSPADGDLDRNEYRSPPEQASRTESLRVYLPSEVYSSAAANTKHNNEAEKKTRGVGSSLETEVQGCGCTDSPKAKEPTRVLQLKAKFERRRKVVTDSELQQPSSGSLMGASRRERRQSECARRVGPSATERRAAAGQSVSIMRSRFEESSRIHQPVKSTSKSAEKLLSSRKCAEKARQQIGGVDIAARYGKPYRRKEKPASEDEQDIVSTGPDSTIYASVHPYDKSTADRPLPVASAVEREGNIAATERGASVNGRRRVNKRDMLTEEHHPFDSAAASPSFQTSGEQQGGADSDGDERDVSALVFHGLGETATESSPVGLCGHPSPEIERLAALVAAQAQNYGKPVPRRLLTRQDADAS